MFVHSARHVLINMASFCVLTFAVALLSDVSAASAAACRNGGCHTTARAAVSPHQGSLCVRFRCKTVAADADAEILFVNVRREEGAAPIVGTYARWRANGRVTLLASVRGDSSETIYGYNEKGGYRPVEEYPIALAGRYVAFVKPECGSSPTSCPRAGPAIRVNIKTGQREHSDADPKQPRSTISSIVVTAKGSVAWIEGHYSVRVVGATATLASSTLLASSLTIAPESLATAGGYLYWAEAGQPHAAPIE